MCGVGDLIVPDDLYILTALPCGLFVLIDPMFQIHRIIDPEITIAAFYIIVLIHPFRVCFKGRPPDNTRSLAEKLIAPNPECLQGRILSIVSGLFFPLSRRGIIRDKITACPFAFADFHQHGIRDGFRLLRCGKMIGCLTDIRFRHRRRGCFSRRFRKGSGCFCGFCLHRNGICFRHTLCFRHGIRLHLRTASTQKHSTNHGGKQMLFHIRSSPHSGSARSIFPALTSAPAQTTSMASPRRYSCPLYDSRRYQPSSISYCPSGRS